MKYEIIVRHNPKIDAREKRSITRHVTARRGRLAMQCRKDIITWHGG